MAAARLALRTALVVCLAAACGAEDPRDRADRPLEAAPAPLDVNGVVSRVRHAFRPVAGGFEGGGATYRVAVAGGAVAVRPVRHEEAAAAPGLGGFTPPAAPGRRVVGPALELETEAVGAVRAPAVAEAGAGPALRLRRGDVVEELENRPDGLEQRWRFAAAPATTGGELVVRVRASGLAYAGATDGGLHFADAATGLGVRYGVATWIDAAGERTTVRPAWRDGAIVIAVPAEVVARSVYPAVLDPIIGPEIGMDSPVSTAGFLDQVGSAVAFDGTNHLVVFMDNRDLDFDVYGVRVGPTGTILDPNGFLVAAAANDQMWPAVAWNGANYLVTWQDSRTGSYFDIYATRVSAAGAVVDAAPLVVAAAGTNENQPRVAAGGSDWLVTWYEDGVTGPPYTVYFRRVSGAGAFLDAAAVALTPTGTAGVLSDVAWNGTNYLVAWSVWGAGANWDLQARRVSSAGVAIDAAPINLSTAAGNQLRASVASTGLDYAVIWDDGRNSASTGVDIYGVRVTSAGAVAPPGEVAISNANDTQQLPRIVWSGTSYLAIWEDRRNGVDYDVYAAIVGTSSVGANFQVASGAHDQRFPVVAPRAGGGWLAAWSAHPITTPATPWDVYAARLNTAGTSLDPTPIRVSNAVNEQGLAAVAWDGTNYLVVWTDTRSAASYDVYAIRVSGAGTVLDATAIPIATTGAFEMSPAVAFDGANYLVVWEDDRNGSDMDVFAKRVTPAGAVLDAAGFTVAAATGAQGGADVAWNGTNYLVTWQDGRNPQTDVYATRVSASGTVVDVGGFSVAATPSNEALPAVAAAGAGWLVAWHTTGGSNDVLAARVSAGGAVLDAAGILVTSAANTQEWVDVASDGTDYLVVWHDGRAGTPERDIYGQRVAGAGGVSGSAIAIATGGGIDRVTPALAWDGYMYQVMWVQGATNRDLHARRVRADGAAVEAASVAVSTEATSEGQPALASDGTGEALVAYIRDDPAAPFYGAQRVRARLVTLGDALGAGCTLGSTCVSGSCIDGVCCDTTCGGGSTGDCEACSVAAGAAADGTCATLAAATVCRPAAPGSCDVAESCDGAATACPPDAYAAAGTVCRAEAAGGCDVAELCTGVSATCAADAKQAAGFECRASTGGCDPAETCDGAGDACPADALAGAGSLCRASAGICDPAETCDGASGACPADTLAAAGTTCRTSAGACDPAESCTGGAATCPADALSPAGATCRAGDGVCDAAETCDGAAVACPPDVVAPNGTSCANGELCDGDEVCLGGACQLGDPLDCDDGDDCTADSCTEPDGCDNAPIESCCTMTAECDDGNDCTMDSCLVDNTCSHAVIPGCAPDAGSDSDAGDEPPPDDGGCGCHVASRTRGPSGLLLLLALALLIRRRR